MLVSAVQQSEPAICTHISPNPLPLEPPSYPPYPTPLGRQKADIVCVCSDSQIQTLCDSL